MAIRRKTVRLLRKQWQKSLADFSKIPPGSPDLNPIENVFHLVGEKLSKNALEKNIRKETYQQFCRRIKQLYNFPEETVSKTIATMGKHIDMIITSGGNHVKY